MSRACANWIDSYIQYSSFTEAPKHVSFWVAVSTIAGALGRKVWIDQKAFKWFPNFYIFLIGPPDVISKSTTMKMGMRLLEQIPGFLLGPTSCSWQALIKEMQDSMGADYDFGDGKIVHLCQCTVSSTELGNFLKPQDGEFLDTMISLWDGDSINKKLIKDGGSIFIENPILNLNGCTTPSWVAMNIPEHMLEGGLLSRVIFVYGDKVDHPVAYPADSAPSDLVQQETRLISDLIEMDHLRGPLTMTAEAKEWGTAWYNEIKTRGMNGDEKSRDKITRKQTHVHKLAIILSIARSDLMIIEREDLEEAVRRIDSLSLFRTTVINSVGKTVESTLSDRILDFICKKKACKMEDAYREVHSQLPNSSAFLEILNGLVKSGQVKETSLGGEIILTPKRNQ